MSRFFIKVAGPKTQNLVPRKKVASPQAPQNRPNRAMRHAWWWLVAGCLRCMCVRHLFRSYLHSPHTYYSCSQPASRSLSAPRLQGHSPIDHVSGTSLHSAYFRGIRSTGLDPPPRPGRGFRATSRPRARKNRAPEQGPNPGLKSLAEIDRPICSGLTTQAWR
jgi:hypothetical protein